MDSRKPVVVQSSIWTVFSNDFPLILMPSAVLNVDILANKWNKKCNLNIGKANTLCQLLSSGTWTAISVWTLSCATGTLSSTERVSTVQDKSRCKVASFRQGFLLSLWNKRFNPGHFLPQVTVCSLIHLKQYVIYWDQKISGTRWWKVPALLILVVSLENLPSKQKTSFFQMSSR